jgi:NAD kinase
LIAINEIIVHNSNPRKAIRYTVHVDDKQIGNEIIGDGIVVATPSFGSTGYYRSITDSFFEVGIGLAFNNSIEQSDHMVLRDNRVIKLNLVRGPADVYADNQESSIELCENESVTIRKSEDTAKIVVPRE